jgi:hypothetical protein
MQEICIIGALIPDLDRSSTDRAKKLSFQIPFHPTTVFYNNGNELTDTFFPLQDLVFYNKGNIHHGSDTIQRKLLLVIV